MTGQERKADTGGEATRMPDQIPLIESQEADPNRRAMKCDIATKNGQVIDALKAKRYEEKWTYALLANPAEVVAEVFTALMHNRNVPKGMAAVYVAYEGLRSQRINDKLRRIFGGEIPAFDQPEDAIHYINTR